MSKLVKDVIAQFALELSMTGIQRKNILMMKITLYLDYTGPQKTIVS